MGRDDIIYAGIGALVTIFTVFIPFSPFLGGLLAGWLADDTGTDGWRVGLLAGAFASLVFIPLVLVGLFVSIFDAGVTLVILSTISLLGMIYTLGFSALGGYIGGLLQGRDSESTRPDRDQSQRRSRSAHSQQSGGRDSDLERLKREYAAGKLTEAEFERRLERQFGIDRESVRDEAASNGDSRPRSDPARESQTRDWGSDRRSDDRLTDR